ncbi:MAG TPA: asparaginase [Anaerolineae bacterium]|nr:asparaginase [Anaerolineae bacterium]
MKKRIYLAYTGGTIGMEKTTEGYRPVPGYLAELLAAMPELHRAELPAYTIHEYEPLLDSANMTPADWVKIAQDIADHHDDYDGFIVLHGTDTMAYTASALSFMLHHLAKPVVLTGSQIPLCEARNDARENLITAMLIAANYAIPEVCLYFGNKLMRGCRTTKVSADGFEAFASPNYPPLATVGIDIDPNWTLVQPPPNKVEPIRVQIIDPPLVGALRLFPGISAEFVRHALQPPLKGLVLEAFGVGNGPSDDRAFLETLAEATRRGVVIVDCTQCLIGTVNLGGYATGSALAQAGVISGFDMTAEAALTKMFYLFSQDLPVADVKRLMQTNLRGELTAG